MFLVGVVVEFPLLELFVGEEGFVETVGVDVVG